MVVYSSEMGKACSFDAENLTWMDMQEKIKEFGQDIFLAFQATNGIGNKEKAALLNLEKLSRDGFEKLISKITLDALVTPGSDAAHVLAIGGVPWY